MDISITSRNKNSYNKLEEFLKLLILRMPRIWKMLWCLMNN